MTNRTIRAAVAAGVAALAVAGCGGVDGQAMAGVMCEQFVDDRVGVELEHDGPMEGATVTGESPGPFVVESRFADPVSRAFTDYTCTVEDLGDDQWRLVDLTTSR